MNIEKREQVQKKIIDVTCGLLAGTTDILLYFIYQGFNAGKYGYGSIAMRRSVNDSIEEVMALGIDGETVKKAIWNITHRKFIKRTSKNTVEITKEGIKKLSELIPSYHQSRSWNGHFYLVIYDISEKKRRARRILRDYLRKLGCGLLQDSVWLTPYNPKEVLQEFIESNSLSGSIIVSDVGKDGSIGDENLNDLVERVYRLEEINRRYIKFVAGLSHEDFTEIGAKFQYLSILQDDPQLPFEILPNNWMGDKTYLLMKEKHLL